VTAYNETNGVEAEYVSGDCADACEMQCVPLSAATARMPLECIAQCRVVSGVQKFTGEHLFLQWRWMPEMWRTTTWY
jgi:hypothetical protein